MIIQIFNEAVANHVERLTRIKPYGKISAEESLNLLVTQKRYDTALIKLFDRLHNLQTLGAKSPEKAKKIIQETINAFIWLTIYLEIPSQEQKLIALCYKYLPQDLVSSKKNHLLIFYGTITTY